MLQLFRLDIFERFQQHDLFLFPAHAFYGLYKESTLEAKVFQFPFAFHITELATPSFSAFSFLLSAFLFFQFLQLISFFPPILHLAELTLKVSPI